MNTSLWSRFTNSLRFAENWYLETPDRALDEAYDAALMIQSIENEHFGGQLIFPEYNPSLGQVAFSYFEQERERYLRKVRMRLTEFRNSRSAVDLTNPKQRRSLNRDSPDDQATIVLEKLKFIDQVLSRYSTQALMTLPNSQLATTPPLLNGSLTKRSQSLTSTAKKASLEELELANVEAKETAMSNFERLSDNTGVLPRSILSTIGRIRRDLDPEAEKEVRQDFRSQQLRTRIAVRFVLSLIAIPLLFQLSIRNFALSDRLIPGHLISQRFAITNPASIFINHEMSEEAFKELSQFEERLKFETLLNETLGQTIDTPEVREEKLRDKVDELANDFSKRSSDAIKNWIADLAGVAIFIILLQRGKQEMAIVRSFIDEIAYGLSDSAKAFIIILFTDVFVGFHSPHGWEVLLEGIAEHLGVAANRSYISLFIATFPVILDTIFKYWIFRYLNRISPSAVATYKEMNE